MSGRVRWNGGGSATIEVVDVRTIVLRSTVPFPPGSRVEGILEGAGEVPLRVKVHASKKQPDGEFRVEGRPLDLTREVRERLERER